MRLQLMPSVLVALMACACPVGADTLTIWPFGTSGIRYHICESPPDSYWALDYDDSGWLVGTAPFGSNSPDSTCLVGPVGTHWVSTTRLLVRVWVDIPAGATSVISVTHGARDAYISINGIPWASCGGTWCPYWLCGHEFGPYVPWHEGLNLWAVQAHDFDVTWRYFDFELTCVVEGTAVNDTASRFRELSTWSTVKALYR